MRFFGEPRRPHFRRMAGLFVEQLPGLKGLEGANRPLVDEESKAQKDQAYFKASHD